MNMTSVVLAGKAGPAAGEEQAHGSRSHVSRSHGSRRRRGALWLPFLFCCLALLEGMSDAVQAAVATGVFANVPEASDYTLVYTLPIPTSGNFNSSAVPYSVDNSATTPANFDRVAYYLELQSGAGALQYVYVSFDKLAGMTAASKIGVPNVASGEFFQQNLANMNVVSNVEGVVTGTGIQTGNIEFWPSNYSNGNSTGVPNASSGTFDFGDDGANGSAGYGSMQIHNHDLDGAGAGTDGQTLLAYNAWGAGSPELGIGNAPSGSPDWTFAANASTYTVRNLQILVRDTAQTGNPSFIVNTIADHDDGNCGTGDCTLREAISAANSAGVPSEVTFAATVFAIKQTITLSLGEMTITDHVAVAGPTSGGVTLDVDTSSRHFYVDSFGDFTLKNLTLTGGNGAGTLSSGNGGAIAGEGTMTVENCTFTDNSATASGGAVYVFNAGSLTVSNSTFSGNSAGTSGGAIAGDASTLVLTSSTLTANSDPAASLALNGGDATIGNTIFNGGSTNNYATSGGATLTSQGYNLSSDGSGPNNGTTDRLNTDPLLAPLADNGGPTQTHALLPGSPAINSGDSALGTDQRGVTRPQGVADDVGSYEAVGLLITNAATSEGNSGLTDVTLTVTLSSPLAQTVTVDYATAPLTSYAATADVDYVSSSGTLTFAPGDTSEDITVQVKGDLLHENFERFAVNLSNSTNAVILDGEGVVTINDDDAVPSLSIDDITVLEGDAGTTNATFTVSLSAPSGQTVTVKYITGTPSSNPATPGSDYVALKPGTLNFAPGETSKQVTVLINGDTTVEGDELFLLKLSNSTNATVADSEGFCTIAEDDTDLSINNITVTEGNPSSNGAPRTTNATFTVSLAAASSKTVTVHYATGPLSTYQATAGSDYVATSGTLSFAPGQTSKSVTVQVIGDTLDEADERFAVNLSGATNAFIGDREGTCVITDDDATPSLSIDDVSLSEGDGRTTAFTFTVTLSAPSGQSVTVKAATVAPATSPATAGSDYTALPPTTLTFAPGQTSRQVTVLVNGDTQVEANEKFVVRLSAATNATIADFEGFGTILNDDAATLLFEQDAPSE